jgi:hypothetical protein
MSLFVSQLFSACLTENYFATAKVSGNSGVVNALSGCGFLKCIKIADLLLQFCQQHFFSVVSSNNFLVVCPETITAGIAFNAHQMHVKTMEKVPASER